jgi:hypothetical protein
MKIERKAVPLKDIARVVMAAVMMTTAPGLGGYEAAAAGLRIARTAPLPGALGLAVGTLGRLPAPLPGPALPVPGVLPSPTFHSPAALPSGGPSLSVPLRPAVAAAALPSGVVRLPLGTAGPARAEAAPQAEWRERIAALGEEVGGISAARGVGGQAAGLAALFHGERKAPAMAAATNAVRPAAHPVRVVTERTTYSVRLGSARGLGDRRIARLAEKVRAMGYYVLKANLNTGELLIEKGAPGSGFKTDVRPLRRLPEVLEIAESRRLDTIQNLFVRARRRGAAASHKVKDGGFVDLKLAGSLALGGILALSGWGVYVWELGPVAQLLAASALLAVGGFALGMLPHKAATAEQRAQDYWFDRLPGAGMLAFFGAAFAAAAMMAAAGWGGAFAWAGAALSALILAAFASAAWTEVPLRDGVTRFDEYFGAGGLEDGRWAAASKAFAHATFRERDRVASRGITRSYRGGLQPEDVRLLREGIVESTRDTFDILLLLVEGDWDEGPAVVVVRGGENLRTLRFGRGRLAVPSAGVKLPYESIRASVGFAWR